MRQYMDQREFVKVITILLRRGEYTIPVSGVKNRKSRMFGLCFTCMLFIVR